MVLVLLVRDAGLQFFAAVELPLGSVEGFSISFFTGADAIAAADADAEEEVMVISLAG